MGLSSFAAALGRAALGGTPRRRAVVAPNLLTLALTIAFACLQHAEVGFGLIDPVESFRLSVANVGVMALFYATVRSGLSERLGPDPALTLAQMTWGVIATAASYAITGPARGAVLTLMVVILVFGMFALTVAQSQRIAAFALLLLGTTMLWKSQEQPDRYPPSVEVVHFIFLLLTVASVSRLAGRMGAMRTRLQAQKQSLREQTAALEHALHQIRRLAIEDELTGLCNRRHMRELLDDLGAQRPPIALALLDIDLFKSINDRFGHAAGDAVLKRFADAGRSVLRTGDVLSRWGGEEFLLMLPGTAEPQARLCVERLRANLREVSLADVAPDLRVTFSAGISVCTDARRLDAAIEAADQAMYRAKTLGRDRLVSAAEPLDRTLEGEVAAPAAVA